MVKGEEETSEEISCSKAAILTLPSSHFPLMILDASERQESYEEVLSPPRLHGFCASRE